LASGQRNEIQEHHEFSFTDCVSFVVMKELRLTDALATDNHFRIAGFDPLLAE
jgi:predicted nucleic acid-binding protein